MRKFWNSLLHGSSRTKRYLCLLLLLFALGAACLLIAIANSSLVFAAAGIGILLFAAAVYHYTKFEENVLTDKKKGEKEKKEKAVGGREEETEKDLDASARDFLDGIRKETSWDQKASEEEAESHTEFFKNYGEGRLRELKRQFQVNKTHKTMMIDSCPLYHIKQCPAYAWKEKGKLMLLLLEEEPRTLSISLDQMDGIYYEADAMVGKMSDYQEFRQPSIVSSIFAAHLPDTHEKTLRTQPGIYKNLYVFGPGIRVTNTSARNLFDLLKAEFKLDNEIMRSNAYDPYLKTAYKAHVLWKDGVIDTKEYQSRIKTLIHLKITDIPNEDLYRAFLSQMIEMELITKEYARYADSLWQKEHTADK